MVEGIGDKTIEIEISEIAQNSGLLTGVCWKKYILFLLDDSNVDDFLNGWPDNRIRVLLFGHIDIVRLRYLTTAYRFRYRAAFG